MLQGLDLCVSGWLVARGAILNHGTILEEAGLTRSQSRIPEIDALLREWVRRYASVDG